MRSKEEFEFYVGLLFAIAILFFLPRVIFPVTVN